MRRIQIGDVFELNTPKGKAYLQYVSQHKGMGELIRILPGLFESQPETMNSLVEKEEMFFIHFPLKAALKQSIVTFIDKYEVPNAVQIPTRFRDKHVVKGNFICWHIVDYATWNRKSVDNLSTDEIHLSPWGIWNDTFLIERLVEGWTLEQWI
jgi:hypothetical protein